MWEGHEPDGVLLERARWRLSGRPRRGGFAMVELNVAGWSALLGVGVVVGGVLWLIGLTPVVAFPVGVGGIWAIAVVVDWRRERESMLTVSYGDDATAWAIYEGASATGIPVELVLSYESDGEPDLAILVKDKHMRRLDEIVQDLRRS